MPSGWQTFALKICELSALRGQLDRTQVEGPILRLHLTPFKFRILGPALTPEFHSSLSKLLFPGYSHDAKSLLNFHFN